MKLSLQRTGAVIRGSVKAGRSYELGSPHVYWGNVPVKAYFDACDDTPIHTYGT
ncbi:UDP-3-O-(3-hydroxymyristoyl)glucosamine N-acyltransferase [Xanthomonas sp. GW]|uniref:hypothetical protein n=1 Tax=Xanthomonas sp. GW TaxID=2724121 RepID=UPI001639C2E4|nr:hypothetical protein [Xanthomonas sp. GW]QNH21410.1 UDP-3-O-(3-hydroxymyristoyl)glucosamine N-acyltransferase [Xanthomonas sp. GW]